MPEPIHSFAILAYGDSPYLEECVRSLTSQTAQSRIYIATSTPSPYIDGIAQHHGVPVQVNPERAGIAADWTYAYRCCETPYLTLAHQDDNYLPDYAIECLSATERCQDNLITFTDYYETDGRRPVAWTCNLLVKRMIRAAAFGCGHTIRAPFRKQWLLSLGCAIPCPSVMFHKRRIGDFSFSPEHTINLDWDAWARLAWRPGSFSYVPQKLVAHRLHGGAATARGIASGERQREDLAMFRRFWPSPVAVLFARAYRMSLWRRARG